MTRSEFEDENYREEIPHGHAESLVGIWMARQYGYRFAQQDLFTESQWVALAEILERFYGMSSIERAMQYRYERASESIERYVEPPLYLRYTKPENMPWTPRGTQELPNGQLSILEAAYEHFGDYDKMRTLIMYYILGDCFSYKQYLPLLRKLCGSDWPDERARMVAVFEQYKPAVRNLAYEYFLAEEELSDAAWHYLCALQDVAELFDYYVAHADDGLTQLFTVAGVSHGKELASLLLEPLQDADSSVLRDDTPMNRLRIATIMRLCRQSLDETTVRTQRKRLAAMYPKRVELQAMLDEVMDGTFDERDVRWVIPIVAENHNEDDDSGDSDNFGDGEIFGGTFEDRDWDDDWSRR